jgi:hypothetical protein
MDNTNKRTLDFSSFLKNTMTILFFLFNNDALVGNVQELFPIRGVNQVNIFPFLDY